MLSMSHHVHSSNKTLLSLSILCKSLMVLVVHTSRLCQLQTTLLFKLPLAFPKVKDLML